MEIVVREYTDEDYDVCRSLWGELTQHHAEIFEAQAIAGSDPGRGFDVYLDRPDRIGVWVAESGNGAIGFAGLLDVIGEEGLAEIEPVVVTASSRGKGTGTRLVRHLVEEAKKRNFRFVSIRPEVRNERAFDLYVRLGFDKVGSIELFHDLSPKPYRKWKTGLRVHNRDLSY